MKIILLSIFLFLGFSLLSSAQELRIFESFEDLEKEVLTITDDKIYIINFWATWCGPCVKELPYFEQLRNNHLDEDVVIILVSIDWLTNLDKKLRPFLIEQNLKNEVVIFDDPKANIWIDKIDPDWSGSIPITLFLSKDNRQFYEKEYHNVEELESDLKNFTSK